MYLGLFQKSSINAKNMKLLEKNIVGKMFLKCDEVYYFLVFPQENSAEGYHMISF